MNAVEIDISKEKSTVRSRGGCRIAVEMGHTASELDKLVSFIRKIDGETRIVKEYIGTYYPIAYTLL